ncbi:uncharacterized protein LOC133339802 [Lethenteron reissneri]|nr:uncharacterized protein LOC133339802 [Lethenteron reissneri]
MSGQAGYSQMNNYGRMSMYRPAMQAQPVGTAWLGPDGMPTPSPQPPSTNAQGLAYAQYPAPASMYQPPVQQQQPQQQQAQQTQQQPAATVAASKRRFVEELDKADPSRLLGYQVTSHIAPPAQFSTARAQDCRHHRYYYYFVTISTTMTPGLSGKASLIVSDALFSSVLPSFWSLAVRFDFFFSFKIGPSRRHANVAALVNDVTGSLTFSEAKGTLLLVRQRCSISQGSRFI